MPEGNPLEYTKPDERPPAAVMVAARKVGALFVGGCARSSAEYIETSSGEPLEDRSSGGHRVLEFLSAAVTRREGDYAVCVLPGAVGVVRVGPEATPDM